MNRKRLAAVTEMASAAVFVLVIVALIVFSFSGQPAGFVAAAAAGDSVTTLNASDTDQASAIPQGTDIAGAERLQVGLSPNGVGENASGPSWQDTPEQQTAQPLPQNLTRLYEIANPGVVNVGVIVQEGPTIGEGVGSGFVFDDQGHIVTNNHVIAGARQVIVTYSTGEQTFATVVGRDPDTDLAVILVEDMPEGITPLVLGDLSSVRVGDWVVAIGSPFGLGSSMTAGIVSAVGRTIPAGAVPFGIPEAIQTDAAINPGNSGGPLLNMEGEVIGVNAQIITASERTGSAGVGFAIPVNIVRRIVPALIETGSYQHPYLGIEGTSLNLLLAEANDLPVQQGVYVDRVVPGGPASQVGMRGSTDSVPFDGLSVPVGGDVIVQADGQPVNNYTELLSIIESHQPGDELALTILRNGRRQEVTVELAPRPTGATS
ncbi:MAG: PDZ domain-containing protein [Chloroflexi bacterium]|jgi:2-alkenal reductase|nr:PDZ domain-containing protein [Chloroflexota bacterium]